MSKTTITVRRKDVATIAEIAFADYRGPRHKVAISESMRVTAADLCWSGGSRSRFVALRQPADGSSDWQVIELETVSPWSGDRWEGPIPDDVILVEHSEFCGKDMGLTYHVSPTSKFLAGAKHLLSSADAAFSTDPEMRCAEEVVLKAHAALKSSYRDEEYRRAGLSRSGVEAAKDRLIARGLLATNKLGATRVTVEGENLYRALAGR